MGGNGTYSLGISPEYTYETVGKIDGVKILKPKDPRKQFKLPEESHSPNARYVLLDKDGVFHQYREYNENHQVVFEIGYHYERSLGKEDVLHVHVHNIPGVKGHDKARKFAIGPGDQYYEKYKNFFKGVKVK